MGPVVAALLIVVVGLGLWYWMYRASPPD